MKKKILITGASGFLGSHLAARLSQRGDEIHAVSRSERANANGIRCWKCDMADLDSARQLIASARPDVVYHLAGLSTGVPDFQFVLPTMHSLLVSTVNVLTIANEIGNCRVVLAASLTEPEPAQAEPTPGSPYAAAKWAASGYARMFHHLYKLPVVLVRPFMTYGPGQNPNKVIPHVIASLFRGDSPKLAGGLQQFDWIYIDDVIDAFVAAADANSDRIFGRTIDIGTGTAVSIREVVERIVAIMKPKVKPLFGALPDRPLEWVRVADTRDAYERLNWKPTTSLDEGLAKTIESHDANRQHLYSRV